MLAPFLVMLTHFAWVSSWWCVGHFFYLMYRGWENSHGVRSFGNHSNEDFLGIMMMFIASYFYCWLGHKVINTLYGGNLPVQQIANIAKSIAGNNGNFNGLPRDQRRKLEKEARKAAK